MGGNVFSGMGGNVFAGMGGNVFAEAVKATKPNMIPIVFISFCII